MWISRAFGEYCEVALKVALANSWGNILVNILKAVFLCKSAISKINCLVLVGWKCNKFKNVTHTPCRINYSYLALMQIKTSLIKYCACFSTLRFKNFTWLCAPLYFAFRKIMFVHLNFITTFLWTLGYQWSYVVINFRNYNTIFSFLKRSFFMSSDLN